jgi:hypothetical protein
VLQEQLHGPRPDPSDEDRRSEAGGLVNLHLEKGRSCGKDRTVGLKGLAKVGAGEDHVGVGAGLKIKLEDTKLMKQLFFNVNVYL